METKHTPGPWMAGKFSSILGVPIIAQPDKFKNALVVAGTQSAASIDPQEFRAECEANALLIAAAPELLEALKDASEALYEASDKFHILSGYIKDEAARQCAKDKVDEMSSANVIIRSAIARATGASS